MNIIDIIEKKKSALALSEEEIAFFIHGVCDGSVKDYQAAALLMAICLCGMNAKETAFLTAAMANSGERLHLENLSPTADKHSTGGVGDKTSLIVAPIAAACGVNIAKMSGRGLGHTGGTIDKLESIPGFQTRLSDKAFFEQVRSIGIAIVGQSDNLVPADKILYALRDVTGTVNSIPLIASSIMSKKLAAGADIIELDVKTGSGAFMKTEEDARALARAMVDIGKANGRKTTALITDMDAPLGTHVGNSLELKEVIAVLRGEAQSNLTTLCLTLAAGIIAIAKGMDKTLAHACATQALKSGSALEKLRQMVLAQGGDVSYIDHPEKFDTAAFSREIKAPREGFVQSVHAEKIGKSACLLGAGRTKKEDTIDHAAGIVLAANIGEYVCEGDTLATLMTNRKSTLENAEALCLSAFTIASQKTEPRALIRGEIT